MKNIAGLFLQTDVRLPFDLTSLVPSFWVIHMYLKLIFTICLAITYENP